jgi:plasmid rolling circle replication initiator protein Rep
MNYKKMQIDKNSYLKFSKRIQFNYLISDYYMTLYEKSIDSGFKDDSYLKKAEQIKNCCTLWDINYYRMQGVKDITRVNLCKNKFCMNCQSAIAQKRYKKFKPMLNELSKEYDIYHVVFTVPNCTGALLKKTLNDMYKSYSYLNRYLLGKAKVKGINFIDMFGYVGGIRSLEITYNQGKDTYHPHLHCLFILKKGLFFDKTIINEFSYNYKTNILKKFSQQEILFQKIWCLLNTQTKVNKKNIDTLELGYSVIINSIEDEDYGEVFKYALKNNFKDGVFLTPEVLELFEDVLHRRRIIQGYGLLLCYEFDNLELSTEEIDKYYLETIAELSVLEKPSKFYEPLNTMLFNMTTDNNITYISRQSIKDYIIEQKTLENQDKKT